MRYRLSSVLALVVCAMTPSGHDSITAAAEWCRRATPEELAAFGLPYHPLLGRYRIPSEKTLRSILGRLDPGEISAAGHDYLRPLLSDRAEEGTFMSQRHIDVTALASEACPVAEVLDHVSGKWSIGILVTAAQGPVRFTELERSITGISRRMLTLNLRELERDGLLVRTVHPVVPPKVEYTLTEMARELHASLLELTDWAKRHGGSVAAAQAAYDREHNG